MSSQNVSNWCVSWGCSSPRSWCVDPDWEHPQTFITPLVSGDWKNSQPTFGPRKDVRLGRTTSGEPELAAVEHWKNTHLIVLVNKKRPGNICVKHVWICLTIIQELVSFIRLAICSPDKPMFGFRGLICTPGSANAIFAPGLARGHWKFMEIWGGPQMDPMGLLSPSNVYCGDPGILEVDSRRPVTWPHPFGGCVKKRCCELWDGVGPEESMMITTTGIIIWENMI